MSPEWRYSMFLFNVVILTACIISLLLDDSRRSLQMKLPSTKNILLWNPRFNHKRWDLTDDIIGPEVLRDSLHCPTADCVITNDQYYLESAELYDAIVFYPSKETESENFMPSKRCDNQLYVFALTIPPPYMAPTTLNQHNQNFYNLTMTYRVDSDIVWPLHRFIDIETNAIVSPAKRPSWRQPSKLWNDTAAWSLELWAQKSHDAAWSVTQCYTSSQRELIFESLQRYIDVDLYGNCGAPQKAKLSRPLFKKYKFYLSFENALCRDYVTEDFYRALENGVIPIVYGGADYNRFAPPHSYINIEDFESLEELATHLRQLSMNPKEYLRYFWWHQHYHLAKLSPFCDLCEELHNRQEKVQTYQDIQRWWYEGNCRFERKIKI